jgi:hypothetical protein
MEEELNLKKGISFSWYAVLGWWVIHDLFS